MKQLNRDQIKYIAIVLMFMDHVIQNFYLCDGIAYEFLDALTHFTYITMSFFLVEGFCYTKSRKRYAQRLFIFALVAQFPYMMMIAEGTDYKLIPLNVFFTLGFGFLMIWGIDSEKEKWKKGLYAFLGIIACTICDWSFVGGLATLLFYKARGNRKKQIYAYAAIIILFDTMYVSGYAVHFDLVNIILFSAIGAVGFILSAICVLVLYNGRRSEKHLKFNKWFFYFFYPAHLLIIGIAKLICLKYYPSILR